MELAALIEQYLPAFEQRYAQALLPSHRTAIHALLRCRTPAAGEIHLRWGGFRALRARWLDHLDAASRRPVILIGEAQEMEDTDRN